MAENKTVRQGHNSKAPSRPASKSQSGPGKCNATSLLLDVDMFWIQIYKLASIDGWVP